MYNIPLFKKVLEGIDESECDEKLIDFISKDIKIKKALIQRYANTLGKIIYSEQNCDNIRIALNRCCGMNNLDSVKIPAHKDEPLNVISNKLMKCVIC